MRNLKLLLGSTAQAVSLTLAAFFLGIALGSYWWGRNVQRISNGLRLYALLEAGIGLLALWNLFLIPFYESLIPIIWSVCDGFPGSLTLVKFVLGSIFLVPPCFLMGGTYPAMTEYLYRSRSQLGWGGPLLYGLNTLGGALGAFAAGFIALGWFGFRTSYFLALGLSGFLGVISWVISKYPLSTDRLVPTPVNEPPCLIPWLGWREIQILAFGSGFTTLAIEVLWTRMFEQVLHNSVYTFTLILVAFLICLGVGGFIASSIARREIDPLTGLVVLGSVIGLTVGLTPFVFCEMTHGLEYLGSTTGWWGYLWAVSMLVAVSIGVPGILMGTLFPALLKIAEPHTHSTGKTVGTLTLFNTLGGVVGSLAGAFLFLDRIGLWEGIRAIACLYFGLTLLAGLHLRRRNRIGVVMPVGGMLTVVLLFNTTDLPKVRISADKRVLQFWEGSAGTVAVVESPKTRSILVNNYYTLGGRIAKKYQETMSHIPLLAHPNPRSVFYLGMGTGITAGGALPHPVDEVVVTELIPEAVEASRLYFSEDTRGLFEDPRVEILVEDGRFVLASIGSRFDVIIGDLFTPWKAGTGNLYSLDHYRMGFTKLKQGGVYAQWIPLYQVSEFELGTIARTMLEVFPRVSLWRGDFFKDRSILLLLGHQSPEALDPIETGRRVMRLGEDSKGFPFKDPSDFWQHYCGSISKDHSPFGDGPVNTDDLPVIEYSAPITMRKERSGELEFVRGSEFLDLMEWLEVESSIASDPIVSNLTDRERDWIREGSVKHRAAIR